MNVQPKRLTPEQFLAWAETQPKEAGSFELWDGVVIEKHGAAGTMNAERSQHWRMKFELAVALRQAIRAAKFDAHVVVDGASVRLPGGRMCEPDVLIYIGPRIARDVMVVENPVIVCEILSPSTATFDLSSKRNGYFALPSVAHYLVGDPDEPALIHHRRDGNGIITSRHINRATKLQLDPPGIVVDLDEVLEL